MRIKIGSYYVFDVKNTTRMKENLSINVVQVIGKQRRGLFKPTIYECMSLEDSGTIYATKKQLIPTNPVNTQYFIRYPIDAPMVTKNDIVVINKAIKELKKHYPNTQLVDDMIALCYKLSFYISINNVNDISEDI